MHGRRKVTSEKETEAKQKERKQKLRYFETIRDKIWKKKDDGEFDQEGLDLSAKLLVKSPDVNSLWNFRRVVLQRLLQPQTEVDSSDTTTTDAPCAKLFQEELHLTEVCLQANPKSYGAWHHRAWIIERMKLTDFSTEIRHCNEALKMDERNFHCWDYRRFVCSLAKVPLDDELAFSLEKIQENFSNYSAWHYRSALLAQRGRRADDDADALAVEEFSLVQNAFFTDPEDSSAWFYHYWLLTTDEGGCRTGDVATPNLSLVILNSTTDELALLFTRPIALDGTKLRLKLTVESPNQSGDGDEVWRSSDGSRSSFIWLCEKVAPSILENPFYVQILDAHSTLVMSERVSLSPTGPLRLCVLRAPSAYRFPPAVVAALNAEIDACRQLVELERDNKWPLLNLALTLRAIDAAHRDEIDEICRRLETVDRLRAAFYRDLRSRFAFEDACARGGELCLAMGGCSLSRVVLTNFDALRLVEIDVSRNAIGSLDGLRMAINLRRLVARENRIRSIDALENARALEHVDVTANELADGDEICGFVRRRSGGRLMCLCLVDNPVCANERLAELRASDAAARACVVVTV